MSGTIGGIVFNTPAQISGGQSGRFAGVDQVTLQAWLTAAQTARHNLVIGGQLSQVLYNQGGGSRQVIYTRTSLPQLEAYIADLQAALGMPGPQRQIPVSWA